jgi:hypothetical protein
MIEINTNNINYDENSEQINKLKQIYKLNKIIPITEDSYNKEYLKTNFNITNLSFTSLNEIKFYYNNLKFYIKLTESDEMFLQKLTFIFVLINNIITNNNNTQNIEQNIYNETQNIEQIIYNMLLISQEIDIIKVQSFDKKLKISMMKFIMQDINKTQTNKPNKPNNIIDDEDDSDEDEDDDDESLTIKDIKYVYLKLKHYSLKVNQYIRLDNIKNDFDNVITTKLSKTPIFKLFNTHDFLEKYLCDVFCSHYYELFERIYL